MDTRLKRQERIEDSIDRGSQSSKTCHSSELRIVLLGCVQAGKSSAGNTILGCEEFELKRTAQCVMRQGEVAGRHITVVEAPGWFVNQLLEESTEFCKQEIVLSASKCPPGPHCLLLVIHLGIQFTENHRTELEKHLKLLTKRLWSHTLVLFTCGDCLGNTPIEQHIKSEEKALQWLLEKCGNRYHVLNNEKRGDKTQVTELLEKIEGMVAANSGRCFKMDKEILQEVEQKRREEEEKAKKRMMRMRRQREDMQAKIGGKHHLTELRIVLLGYRFAGKSSAGNTILCREAFEIKRTAQCVKRKGEVPGRHITVIEAPGWWRNLGVDESTELVKEQIMLSMTLCPSGPHCLLLVIRVDSKFKAKQRKALEGHLKLFPETVWSHTLVLFTFGDCLRDTPIEQHIESEWNALQWLVEKCGNRYHVLNNMNKSDKTQVLELLEKIEEMVAGNNGCHFEMESNAKEMGRTNLSSKEVKEKKKRKLEEDVFPENIQKKGKQMELPESSDQANLLLGAEEFFPDVKDVTSKTNYSFRCPRAGQFQCKLTSLVFEMEGKGEVLYRIESWDTCRLDGLGQMQPAGPLYNIDCFKGSVSHLHLPHCEILTEDIQAELAVAHYTGDSLEIIEPLEVTQTHVIIAIQDLSKFGLFFKKIFSPRPINAQVLFFYQPDRQHGKMLHIHLLPGNVPLVEVRNQYMDYINFRTSSKCQLTPGKKYKPHCDGHEFQPLSATFDRDADSNYHPTFWVYVEAESIKISLSDEEDAEVWEPHDIRLTGGSIETATPNINTDAAFVDKHSAQLISRVSSIMQIADHLKSEKMITEQKYFHIRDEKNCAEKMRILFEALESGGPKVKAEFYQLLNKWEPYLVKDLEKKPSSS